MPLTGETIRRFAVARPDVDLVVSNAGLNMPHAGLHDGTVDVAFVRPRFETRASARLA